MYYHQERAIDPLHPYLPLFQGAYEETVTIGGRKRRYLAYIPEKTRESTAGIMILPENGKTIEQVFEESLWRVIADTEENRDKLILIILEPENEHWNTDEAYGDPNGDVAYVAAVSAAARARDKFCIHESRLYITGCREGAVIANMAAMWDPAFYSGIVSIGGADVSDAYLAQARTDLCERLCGYADRSGRNGYCKGDIPVPAWVILDPAEKAGCESQTAAYWRAACKTGSRVYTIDEETVEYRRESDPPYPLNQDKAAYVVRVSTIKNSSADYGNLLLRRIWKSFLSRQQRWMADPEGDLRVAEAAPMEYHCEVIDGWLREWYTYVPESVQDNMDTPAPVVFAMHGYSCNGETYAGNSGWLRVARERGIILVLPSALYGKLTHRHADAGAGPDNVPLPAWNFLGNVENGPDENRFFQALIRRTAEEYRIDRTRLFITGHSHGSMMVQALALTMSETFAAAAPCSGAMFQLDFTRPGLLEREDVIHRKDCEIPIWMFCGEMEPWLVPHLPEKGNITELALTTWRRNNHLEPAKLESWTDNWSLHGDRWHDLIYCNAQDVPMVRFSWVEFMPHATMPEMAYRIWDEYFSHFSREDGKVVYRR